MVNDSTSGRPDDDAVRPARTVEPDKGETTMTIEKAREARRNFNVGESKEHGTFSIASAEASPLLGEFSVAGMPTKSRGSSFCRGANAQAGVIREKERDRGIFS